MQSCGCAKEDTTELAMQDIFSRMIGSLATHMQDGFACLANLALRRCAVTPGWAEASHSLNSFALPSHDHKRQADTTTTTTTTFIYHLFHLHTTCYLPLF